MGNLLPIAGSPQVEDKFINKVTASFMADSYEEYAKKELQAPKAWIKTL